MEKRPKFYWQPESLGFFCFGMTRRFYTEFRNEFSEWGLARLGVQNTKCLSFLFNVCAWVMQEHFTCVGYLGFFLKRYKILKQDSIGVFFSPDITLCCWLDSQHQLTNLLFGILLISSTRFLRRLVPLSLKGPESQGVACPSFLITNTAFAEGQRGAIAVHLKEQTPPFIGTLPPVSPSLKSLMVSVVVKHRVYLLSFAIK